MATDKIQLSPTFVFLNRDDKLTKCLNQVLSVGRQRQYLKLKEQLSVKYSGVAKEKEDCSGIPVNHILTFKQLFLEQVESDNEVPYFYRKEHGNDYVCN